MNKRIWEFLGLLAVAAVVVFVSSKNKALAPQKQPVAKALTPEPRLMHLPSSIPVLEDFENAEGMYGYEEVREMSIPLATSESIARGKELAKVNCASCHGDTYLGDGFAGSNLDPPPRNLREQGLYKYGNLELGIYRTIAYGIEGTGMAPWGDILTDQEIWDITHFIVSIQDDPYGLATPAAYGTPPEPGN